MLRLGLLSRKMYADSSLVRANVSEYDLSPSGMTVEEFREKAVEENGLFVLRAADRWGWCCTRERKLLPGPKGTVAA